MGEVPGDINWLTFVTLRVQNLTAGLVFKLVILTKMVTAERTAKYPTPWNMKKTGLYLRQQNILYTETLRNQDFISGSEIYYYPPKHEKNRFSSQTGKYPTP